MLGVGAPFFDPSGDAESNEDNIKKEVIPLLRKLLLTEELTALRTQLILDPSKWHKILENVVRTGARKP